VERRRDALTWEFGPLLGGGDFRKTIMAKWIFALRGGDGRRANTLHHAKNEKTARFSCSHVGDIVGENAPLGGARTGKEVKGDKKTKRDETQSQGQGNR